MNTTSTTPDESFDPHYNITAKELDRDLIDLNLSVIDLIATEQECEAMYPPGVYQQMMRQILGRKADGSQPMLPD